MRYLFDTEVPKRIKDYSKVYVDNFLNYLIENEYIKSKTANRSRTAAIVVQVFLHNCYLSSINHRNLLTVTFRSKVYAKGFISNGKESKTKVSLQYTKWLFDFLKYNNLGYLDKGGATYESVRLRGRYVPRLLETKKSTFQFNNNIYEDMLELHKEISFKPINNVIILRDDDKNDITFSLPRSKVPIKNLLINLNREVADVEVYDPVKDIHYKLQLRKVFNVCFNRGGRMYDLGIQNLPKYERHRLQIDGKDTCVYDFKAFETSLLYSLQGEKMEGDPYKIVMEGYDNKLLRNICKMIMTRIYYCQDRKELQASVSKSVAEDFDIDRLFNSGKIPEKRIPVGHVIDLLIDKHESVSEYFYGKGDHDPSHVGSLVMDYILEYMIQNHRTAIIPVFDEVICDEDFSYEVSEVMKRAYEYVVGSSMNCIIVKEK
ncbi:hypothetical protein NVP1063O_041 [Vibrio phage 1.063.O._10N.261.45.C7]|nr:hypothetical protein NVP1063O_041 [Vibrio phage 1.063.O._10N.261.45.C7]